MCTVSDPTLSITDPDPQIENQESWSRIFPLKVHKRENFFGADFGFLSKLSYPIVKWMFFTKKFFWFNQNWGGWGCFRAYSECAAAASAHTKYAQQQLLRILSLRGSSFCAYLVCAEVYENFEVWLDFTLSIRRSCCCAYLECAAAAFAHT
jgi:hypothetical protein